MRNTRSESLRAVSRILRIADSLAQESAGFLNMRNFSPARAAKILLGLNIRDYLNGIRSVMRSNLDNQALVLCRSLVENFLLVEYLTRVTFRGKRKLTPYQKGLLFIFFPTFVRGLNDVSFQSHPWFKKARRHRLRLVGTNRKYWHGSNLYDICVELDKRQRNGKTPNQDTYRGLYSHLSFVSHPNSRESGYFEADPKTGTIHLKPHFHLDSTGFLAALYATRSIRIWAVAIRSKQVQSIDKLSLYLKQRVTAATA